MTSLKIEIWYFTFRYFYILGFAGSFDLQAADLGRFKTLCCIPYFLIVIFLLLCIGAIAALLSVFGINSMNEEDYISVNGTSIYPGPLDFEQVKIINGTLIALGIVVGLAIIMNLYTLARMLVSLCRSPAHKVENLPIDMDSKKIGHSLQDFKHTVENISRLTQSLDAYAGQCTRLVVIVDGLDSCEQDKLLQVLDTVNMLFGDQNSPFIIILAIDPHVIVRGIEQNLHSLFQDSNINGHDYLRSIVHLPFFIHNHNLHTFKRYSNDNKETAPKHTGLTFRSSESVAEPRQRKFSRSTSEGERSRSNVIEGYRDSFTRTRTNSVKKSFGSQSNLDETKRTRYRSTTGSQALGLGSVADLQGNGMKDSYFSDINPRNMRRMMNIVAVTGRLLRAHNIDFGWQKMAAWVNLTEQWPYRSSWLILEIEDGEGLEDTMNLTKVYDRIKTKLPLTREEEPLLTIDKNEHKLDMFLANINITVRDVKKFLPCTINVDPYLRKLIKEHLATAQSTSDFMNFPGVYPPAPANGRPPFDAASMGLRPRSRHGSGGKSESRRLNNRSPFATNTPSPWSMGVNPVHQPMMGYSPYMFYPPPMQRQSPPTTMPKRPSKVNLRDGFNGIILSQLSVDGVCDLLNRLEGVSRAKLSDYIKSLRDNNISGVVLYNCELPELKTVMGMAFGDWELFQSLVTILREQEIGNCVDGVYPSIREESVPIDSPPQKPKFSPEKVKYENSIEKPQAHYPALEGSSSDPPPKPKSSNPDKTKASKKESLQSINPAPNVPANRRESIVKEYVFETQAIRNAMDMLGLIDDESDDEEDESGSASESPNTTRINIIPENSDGGIMMKTPRSGSPEVSNQNANNRLREDVVDALASPIDPSDAVLVDQSDELPLITLQKKRRSGGWSKEKLQRMSSAESEETYSQTESTQLSAHATVHASNSQDTVASLPSPDKMVGNENMSRIDSCSAEVAALTAMNMEAAGQQGKPRMSESNRGSPTLSAFTPVSSRASSRNSASAHPSRSTSRHSSVENLPAFGGYGSRRGRSHRTGTQTSQEPPVDHNDVVVSMDGKTSVQSDKNAYFV